MLQDSQSYLHSHIAIDCSATLLQIDPRRDLKFLHKLSIMRYVLIGLAVAAGTTAQSQFTNIPSDVASLIPSSALSLIPSGVLPTDIASATDANNDVFTTDGSDNNNSAASATASGTDNSAATAAGSQTTAAPFIPPPFSTNPGAWSSIYQSIQSDGFSWPSSAYGPGQGPWGGYGGGRDHGGPTNGGRWGGSDGYGPWGSNSWGPSAWQSNSAWRDGPWTQWWGGSACPGSDWPGWTQGPWSTDAPWTSWASCSASTTATSVVTTTVSGVQTTATQYGIQVAQAVGTGGSSGGATDSVGSQGAAPMKTMAPALAALGGAVAIFL
ncbi:hypothetical protein P171DRAFT_217322 [Karstenula rhodostoma CBS 690.94]|uniref:Uncharacterized protein n=1 Tax=Karstenula rhodostoma CBS 690.94 TaxID=1392251 RepID=A0A9P4UFL1_9PLEO|nr:hypothetical protein P171DRAFT_217322 [Karstenula rhodostoma CBS 690.94]